MRLTALHVIGTSPETFFDELFFEKEFNERLYREGLEMQAFEILALEGLGDHRVKRIRVTPRPRMRPPAVLRKLVKGELSYTEEGSWDRSSGVYRYTTVTSVAADRIRIGGRVTATSAGAGRSERTVEVDIDVAVPLVGAQLERFVANELRSSFDRGARFTNQWIADRGL